MAETRSVGQRRAYDDERVEVKIGTGTPRRFVYDEDGRLIGEYGNTVATSVAGLWAEHVWLMPAANEGGYEPLALVGPTTTSWVHGDNLGTPVILTTAAGAKANEMQAAPFGARFRTFNGSPRTALALPGQIIDIADRHYNMHRDYDPTLGRYLQADPIGLAGGDNVYGYVGGNPITGIDPSGLDPVGAAIGGAIGTWGGRAVGGVAGEAVFPLGGGIPGAYAGGLAGRSAGATVGSWIGDIVLENRNKDTRKRIAGMQAQIDKHRAKLQNEGPECPSRNHWENEIKSWEAQIENLRKRLPNGK